jgi:competence protein ComEC
VIALLAVIGFLLGVTAESLMPLGGWAAAFLIVLAASFSLLSLTRTHRMHIGVAVFLFGSAFGIFRVDAVPAVLPPAFAPFLNTNVALEGIVVTDPDSREENQRVTIEVKRGEARTRILAVAPLYPAIRYGEEVEVRGTLEAPAPFDTDGGRQFAYDKFLAKDGIFSIIQQANIQVNRERSGIPTEVLGFFADAKHAFTDALGAALPEPESSLAAGILVGGKQGLGTRLIEAFTITGMLQIVVLSGYNVMIVAEAVRRIFGFLPKRAALIVAGIAIALFVFAAGGGSSAVRAGVMAAIALFARATGRTYDALRGLIAALILMALVNPLLITFDPGLQLSVAATLGLIFLARPIETRLTVIKNASLRDIVATTMAAELFVLPILLYETGNLSLVSLAANVLTTPVMPFAMLFSFIAGVVGLIVPAIAPFVGLPAYIVLRFVIGVATIGASLPFAAVIVPAFPFAFVIIAYAVLGWIIYREAKRPRVAAVSKKSA